MKILAAANYVILAAIAVLFVVPFTWLVVESFSPLNNIGVTAPPYLTLNNFVAVTANGSFVLSILNGLLLSLGGTAISLLFAIGPAYVFSRRKFRLRNGLLLAILFLTGFPTFALLVPTYAYFIHIGLYNSIGGVILFLAALNLPITIWILKNAFDQIPLNVEKAAMVDGSSTAQTSLHIFLPLAFPSIAVVVILNFVLNWGNFYVPFILISSGNELPIAVKIYSFFGAYNVKYNELAALSFVYTVPAIVMYIFAQKYLIKAFSFGGSKG